MAAAYIGGDDSSDDGGFTAQVLTAPVEKGDWVFVSRKPKIGEPPAVVVQSEDEKEDEEAEFSLLDSIYAAAGVQMNNGMGDLRLRSMVDRSWLMPGEKVLTDEPNFGYASPLGKVNGHVIVTNYRMRFEAKDTPVRGIAPCVFDVPLGVISRVEKVGHSNVSRGEDSYGIDIVCKDMRTIRFTGQAANHSRRPLFEHLQKHAFPITNKLQFFAFHYEQQFAFDGWTVYDAVQEYKRMNIPNDQWKITKINDRYDLADTYPALLAIPAAAYQEGEDFLQRVGEFRSKQRIPVLSWMHPQCQATITRSSQPMVGMVNRRSTEDERYLQMIMEANAEAHQLLIYDARPPAKGGGFEEADQYTNCRLIFLDIQNIHVVRQSLHKVKEICAGVDDHWLKHLDESKWLSHIQTILDGACQIVSEVESSHASVLVHCSDGWDRTAQLTALSMLLMDPYYRTIRGFAVLIEKEWCSFGHKFAHRIGHGEDKHGDGERSPIFVQFIDCVWQVMDQYTPCFEFNERYLIDILDELYACRFGTFLYNTDKQRVEQRLKERTKSLWSYTETNRRKYTNPMYTMGYVYEETLRPNRTLHRLKLWSNYYGRHNPKLVAQDSWSKNELINGKLLDRRDLLEQIVLEREKAVQNHVSPKT